MRGTSSVTSTCAALVSRPMHNARARGHAVRCGGSPPARRGGAPFARQPPAVAFLGMRDDRQTLSPGLLEPVVPRREPRDPLRLHPTLSCAGCPGGSVPRCAWRRAAAAGGMPKGGRDPYARYRRPAQPMRRLPCVNRAGGGALVSGRVAQSTVAVCPWCVTPLKFSQFVARQDWLKSCACPLR
jgi:hypothetical protein